MWGFKCKWVDGVDDYSEALDVNATIDTIEDVETIDLAISLKEIS